MDTRNMILAVVLSVSIMIGFQVFFAPEPAPVDPNASATTAITPTAPSGTPAQPAAPSAGPGAPAAPGINQPAPLPG
ncbi:MAG: membrane protein insertase YidC, partial [Rhodospirillaceae bacterium]|nr:membrane protein insertase YidC [Rhodospirillaceae bacterium]